MYAKLKYLFVYLTLLGFPLIFDTSTSTALATSNSQNLDEYRFIEIREYSPSDYTYGVVQDIYYCLDVIASSTNNGANVQLSACGDEDSKLWKPIFHGNYFQLQARHSNKCLKVANGSTASGANIVQETCNGNDNAQLWQHGSSSTKQFLIENKNSGLCLGLYSTPSNGANVVQKPCSTRWHIGRTWMPMAIFRNSAYGVFADEGFTYHMFGSHFKWSQKRMDSFHALNAYFQYEINRSGVDYWDYFRCDPVLETPIFFYWTNLPEHVDRSEESYSDPSTWCKYTPPWDEEFEIKSESTTYQANTVYAVYGFFMWDSEDFGTWQDYQIEGEYCGVWIFCNLGQYVSWDVMQIGKIHSDY